VHRIEMPAHNHMGDCKECRYEAELLHKWMQRAWDAESKLASLADCINSEFRDNHPRKTEIIQDALKDDLNSSVRALTDLIKANARNNQGYACPVCRRPIRFRDALCPPCRGAEDKDERGV
jgi:hypothetical protein